MRVALAMRNKNQSDLSRAFGVSRTLISQKMRGVTSWTIADMEKAGQFLGIAPARFLDPNGLIGRVSSGDVVDDLVGRSLVVNGKGDKQRIVPLPDDLADLISACDGYVFPGRFGGHVEESYIGDRLSSLLGDGWTAHSLRHRYATATWQATHDLLLVSKLLGHASVETTQVYVAMPDERLRAGMAAVRLSA